MTICRNQAMNEGGSYPRSCPTCGLGSKSCPRGVKPDPASGIDPKYYIGDFNVNKYAVLYTDSIYHAGDERSRTNPGHGYPAYTEEVRKIQTFDSEEMLKEWIQRNNSGYGRKAFTAIRYQELKVTETIEVTLN